MFPHSVSHFFLEDRTVLAQNAENGVWRSLVAHLLWEQGAGGSNPLTPTVDRVLLRFLLDREQHKYALNNYIIGSNIFLLLDLLHKS